MRKQDRSHEEGDVRQFVIQYCNGGEDLWEYGTALYRSYCAWLLLLASNSDHEVTALTPKGFLFELRQVLSELEIKLTRGMKNKNRAVFGVCLKENYDERHKEVEQKRAWLTSIPNPVARDLVARVRAILQAEEGDKLQQIEAAFEQAGVVLKGE